MKDKVQNLTSDAALAEAITASLAKSSGAAQTQWYPHLRAHLARVKAANPSDLADRGFLEELWSNESVSSTGMGSVKVGPALDDPEFRQWFSREFSTAVPEDPAHAEVHLTTLYQELERRLGERCGRVARLKLNRVLCARFPKYFTTVADVGALKFLHRAMGGASGDHPVHAHLAIKRRIDTLLGPVKQGVSDGELERLSMPWFLYDHITDETKSEPTAHTSDSSAAPAEGLRPLPALLRRKGLTAIRGSFATLLELVQVMKDNLTRDELADEVRRNNTDLSENSVNAVIGTITREFDLCIRDGRVYNLNHRGLNLLDTRDPDELMEHLLTRILGPDHVIKTLETTPRTSVDLVEQLRRINPGWTSDFMPRSILTWLASLDVIVQDAERRCVLTPRGRSWAEQITWTPEALPPAVSAMATTVDTAGTIAKVPHFAEVRQRLEEIHGGQLLLSPDLVMRLHVGLWSHPVRHFAVLTGISGSGKTQLALNYGRALCAAEAQQPERVRVIPVQPGWFDTAPLFGYVSPISQQYCSTPFLELLLRAARDPDRPYVAILDEMNLSHPEQYLAPLLSAMETEGWIDLHDLPSDVTDVPQRMRYPANLAIIGTLNMDETTHGLSDKVLDRAFTLEFWDIRVDDFPGWGRIGLPGGLHASTRKLLNDLGDALSPVRLHFGWRTIDDVLRYLQLAIDAGATEVDALDAVIYAKVLPKLRGDSTERFHLALETTHTVLLEHALKRCADKVASLIEDLRETGTARFWR